jgi:hypothetical protein
MRKVTLRSASLGEPWTRPPIVNSSTFSTALPPIAGSAVALPKTVRRKGMMRTNVNPSITDDTTAAARAAKKIG